MVATYPQLTDFLVQLGLGEVGHTEKTYLAHLIAVYIDLKQWGCDEDVCRAGMFHSIYGTQRFSGFTLSTERRDEIRNSIGHRAEHLAYLNCMMYRPSFDEVISQVQEPYCIKHRLTEEEIKLTQQDYDDLCRLHLCDWLEQVPRCKDWDYRRESYRAMAQRLGGVAQSSYDRVYALEA